MRIRQVKPLKKDSWSADQWLATQQKERQPSAAVLCRRLRKDQVA